MQLIVLFRKKIITLLTIPEIHALLIDADAQLSATQTSKGTEICFVSKDDTLGVDKELDVTSLVSEDGYCDGTELYAPIEIPIKFDNTNNHKAFLKLIERFRNMNSANAKVEDYDTGDGESSGVVITFK